MTKGNKISPRDVFSHCQNKNWITDGGWLSCSCHWWRRWGAPPFWECPCCWTPVWTRQKVMHHSLTQNCTLRDRLRPTDWRLEWERETGDTRADPFYSPTARSPARESIILWCTLVLHTHISACLWYIGWLTFARISSVNDELSESTAGRRRTPPTQKELLLLIQVNENLHFDGRVGLNALPEARKSWRTSMWAPPLTCCKNAVNGQQQQVICVRERTRFLSWKFTLWRSLNENLRPLVFLQWLDFLSFFYWRLWEFII